MIFQDLNNITDVYAKDGSVIERIYNRASDIIWEKIKSSINKITNYSDICWFPRATYDNYHNIYVTFGGPPIDNSNIDTYKRMYKRDMNTFINSEYWGLWIANSNERYIEYYNRIGHIDINYILGKNKLKNPQFYSGYFSWRPVNDVVKYFDNISISCRQYSLQIEPQKLINENNETGCRYTYVLMRLPIYAENNGKYDTNTYPSGQLYFCYLYDDNLEVDNGIIEQSYYVVRKHINSITKEEEITGRYLSPSNDSEIVFESIINPYNLRYNNIHTLC